MCKIVVIDEFGEVEMYSNLEEIILDDHSFRIVSIRALSDYGKCVECIHWNGPQWGCELAFPRCP